MSDANPASGGQLTSGGRAQKLALQGLVNGLIRGVLRTPLLSRAAGKRLITMYVIGRKSGRRYTVPVAYTRHNGAILIGTEFAWVRNLRTGEPVDIRLAGKRRSADVRVITDEAGVVEYYRLMARDNRQWASFNKIAIDRAGNPSPDDLHSAWAAGGRAVVLTPR